MKTVIMAGGKGTRISSVASDIPKPMISLCGTPVLEREIDVLKRYGFTDIIITVSHLKDAIIDYFGDGSEFGVFIQYFIETEPLGNAGALFRLRKYLGEEFLLLNGDLAFDVNLPRFLRACQKSGAKAAVFAHPSTHPFDSCLLETDENGLVTKWHGKGEGAGCGNLTNAGIHILKTSLLAGPVPEQKVDLDRDILRPLAGTGKLYAYRSPEYVKDMGTPERYEKVKRDFTRGIILKKNLKFPQRAVFLDRDGTINKYVGFLTDADQMELMPGAAQAIRKINESGYLAIVATNQPVIARGEVTRDGLNRIHAKMEALLGKEGAYLDGIYVCPHHPDSGFEGEVKELKCECGCRKPKPGLLLKAAEDFHIDLSESWMAGDEERDIKAGKAAGCRTVFLGSSKSGADLNAKSLDEAVGIILGGNKW